MRGGRVWQEMLDWWRGSSRSGPKTGTRSDPPKGRSPERPGWSTRPIVEVAEPGGARTARAQEAADSSLEAAGSSLEAPGRSLEAAGRSLAASGRSLEAGDPSVDFEASEDDLLEFLAADHEPVTADPKFKASLRKQLWAMIEEESRSRH